MIKKVFLFISMAGAAVNAQIITQNFGSGANAFSIDFVEIGNPGNAPDTSGNPNPAGSVSYGYNIGKYEISRDMIEKGNSAGGLGIVLFDMEGWGFAAGNNGVNRPATGVTWFAAAKFVNYLNISQGKQAAYNFDESGNFQIWGSGQYSGSNQFRNKDAYYFLPSIDEWYKAAYGSLSGIWYDFPSGSDRSPTAVSGGTSDDTAVYGGQSGLADITNAGGVSPFGTMAQGGNVWEWNETAFDGINDTAFENRENRGGSFMDGVASLGLESLPTLYMGVDPGYIDLHIGFRVASVPEPSAFLLLAIGLGALALVRRRS